MKPIVMPCFCLISGHVSPVEVDERRARSLMQLFATYVIFQSLYFLQKYAAFTVVGFPFEPLPVQIFNPQEQVVTWFLLALLIWRVTLPLIQRTRAPLIISLTIGLSGSFVDLGVNYQNILSFWPYFIGGAVLPRTHWETLARPAVRLPFGAFFLVCSALVLSASVYGGVGFEAFFRQATLSYSCLNGNPPQGKMVVCASFRELMMRITWYAASLPLIGGFLCILPRRSGVYAAPGYMSMYVYLIHPLLLYNPLLMKTTFDALSTAYGREVNVWSPATEGWTVCLLAPCALVASALLSLPCCRSLFWPCVEPPIERFLFSAPPAPPPPPASSLVVTAPPAASHLPEPPRLSLDARLSAA